MKIDAAAKTLEMTDWDADHVRIVARRLDDAGRTMDLDLAAVVPLGPDRFAVLRVVGTKEAEAVLQVRPRAAPIERSLRGRLKARIRLYSHVERGERMTVPDAREFLLSENLSARDADEMLEALLGTGRFGIDQDGVLSVRRDAP